MTCSMFTVVTRQCFNGVQTVPQGFQAASRGICAKTDGAPRVADREHEPVRVGAAAHVIAKRALPGMALRMTQQQIIS